MRLQLLTSGVAVGAIRLSGAALALGVTVILSRSLGPAGLGIYAYTLTVLTLATVPVSYGWATLLLRTASEAHHHGDWTATKGLVVQGILGAGLVAVFFLLLIIVLSFSYPEQLPEGITPAIIILITLVLFFDQISALRTAILKGLDQPVTAQIPEMILRPAIVMLTFGTIGVFGSGPKIIGAFAALTIASFVSLGFGYLLLRRRTPAALSRSSIAYDTSAWVSTAWPMTVSSGLLVLFTYLDIIILGFFTNATDIGIYRIAMQAAELSGFGYTALNMIANQRFALFRTTGDRKNLQVSANFIARVSFVSSLVSLLTLIVIWDPIATFVFNDLFAGALSPIVLLCAAQVISAGTGMGRTLLMMHSGEKQVMLHTFTAVGVKILLCSMLASYYGIIGAALGSLISTSYWNISLCLSARKHTNIDTSIFGIEVIDNRCCVFPR